ncbi:hypothetical protein OK411_10830 [Pseudomonas sp. RG1]|uniref:hypothetical protein n=1 Tax=Pseudomonas sp. RG1 TaxID=2981602 RepID=UPI00222126E3|nr:hypothetical protein [Pseudomonas sp. RG1]MCW0920881.1 hypothetical protein [Pseudomonas sp. RG1]
MEQNERKRISNMHTRIIDDGLIFDLVTGEVLGNYTTHAVDLKPHDYKLPQVGKTSATHMRYELAPKPRPDVTEYKVETLPSGVVDLDSQRSKRGPKPKVQHNHHANHFKVAHADRRGWFDDFILGACYTVGGISGGKLNVSPAHVRRACLLNEIGTEIVKRVIRLEGLRTMSDQQARRICQCARFAIGGMELYLERNLTVLQELQFEVDFVDSYHEDQVVYLKVIGGDSWD